MSKSSSELQYPETFYEREVGIKAFRKIVLKALLEIDGVYFLEENIVDSLLGREGVEGVRGIEVEIIEGQPALQVKIHICLASGISIPEKVEEVQSKVVKELTTDTGLHVSRVQVIVEDVKLPDGWIKRLQDRLVSAMVHSQNSP